MHPITKLDYDRTPFVVIWETTQACALACQHCRAEAIDRGDPLGLNLDDGRKLIDQVAEMAAPILVFAGGDPLQREDLCDLIRHAKQRSLWAATIPAATPRLTFERVQELKEAGLDQMALSLDGSSEHRHDTFRGVDGSFEKTIEGTGFAREVGLPLQVNSCFGAWNLKDLEAIATLVERLGIVFREVFFLVPMGRGKLLESLSAQQYEDLFARIYSIRKRVSYIIKITESPHYRRFVHQQEAMRGREVRSGKNAAHDLLARRSGPGGSVGMAPNPVNSGKGFCFISHTGDVFLSGFLPLSAWNVRQQSLASIYRDSPLFRELRDSSLLKGRCGRCEYRGICGGSRSRSRAWALTGDYQAEDPCCVYEPDAASPASVHA